MTPDTCTRLSIDRSRWSSDWRRLASHPRRYCRNPNRRALGHGTRSPQVAAEGVFRLTPGWIGGHDCSLPRELIHVTPVNRAGPTSDEGRRLHGEARIRNCSRNRDRSSLLAAPAIRPRCSNKSVLMELIVIVARAN